MTTSSPRQFPLKGFDVVIGITGSIAAYKSAEIISRLKKYGANVFAVMTHSACEFISSLTIESISGNPVATNLFKRSGDWEVEHIALANRASLFLIAPATANVLAKMAYGIADDMLTSTVLATKAPIVIAPAMNTGMWTAPATAENIQILVKRGVHIIGPDKGLLACGDVGLGRMSEPHDITDRVVALLCQEKQHDFYGVKILVTAGPTRERIDPVRYLTNDSSGKMGYAIADAAIKRGADVTLVSGPVHLPPPVGVRLLPVSSTSDLLNIMLRESPAHDIVVQAAAPADFTTTAHQQKIKMTGSHSWTLPLTRTPDVAKAIGDIKRPNQVFVGFAAETEHLTDNARTKLKEKKLDIIIANDVTQPGAGFNADTNIVTLLSETSTEEIPIIKKEKLAYLLLDRIKALYEEKRLHD